MGTSLKNLKKLLHLNILVLCQSPAITTTITPQVPVTPGRKKRQSIPNSLRSNSLTRVKKQSVDKESNLEKLIKSYGTQLRYECGIARKFYDPEADSEYTGRFIINPVSKISLYIILTERWMTCNWNKTWTQHDYLDDCIWIQCLYPPSPPHESNLDMLWIGDPVEFYDNVSYVCNDEGIRFEWDREMTEFNVTCLPGGTWEEVIEWPNCLLSINKRNNK